MRRVNRVIFPPLASKRLLTVRQKPAPVSLEIQFDVSPACSLRLSLQMLVGCLIGLIGVSFIRILLFFLIYIYIKYTLFRLALLFLDFFIHLYVSPPAPDVYN